MNKLLKLLTIEVKKTSKYNYIFFVYGFSFMVFSMSYEYFFMDVFEFQNSLNRVSGTNPYQLLRAQNLVVYSIVLPLMSVCLLYLINSIEENNNISKIRSILPFSIWKWQIIKTLNCFFWILSVQLLIVVIDYFFIKYFEEFKDWDLKLFPSYSYIYFLYLIKSNFYILSYLFVFNLFPNKLINSFFIFLFFYFLVLFFWSPFSELEAFPDVFDKLDYFSYFFKSNYSIWINLLTILLSVIFIKYIK